MKNFFNFLKSCGTAFVGPGLRLRTPALILDTHIFHKLAAVPVAPYNPFTFPSRSR